MGILDEIISVKEKDEEERSKLSYDKYLNSLERHLQGLDNDSIRANYEDDIVICPEPIEFINEFNELESIEECKRFFFQKKESFKCIKKGYRPPDGIWVSSSEKELRLRPGLKDNILNNLNFISLGDDCVHALVVGRTGSGKSVFLNTLLCNLMNEYSPWEINLFLADFKKVELSKYLSGIDSPDNTVKNASQKVKAPHVNTVAATSEIRYVISLLQYLLSCMNARQVLFKKLNVDKLSSFREKYGVILPRTLLLVDEFQQMFLEATSSESNIINDILLAITKLGRNVGFHLIFASQEMSGSLGGKAMANFKARFALPCNADVSSAILGNSEAAEIQEKGIVLVNTTNGKREDNIRFKVPFITSDDFYYLLKKLGEESNRASFSKTQKYYQEDFIEKISSLESKIKLINDKGAKSNITNSLKFFDVAILGPAVVYNEKEWSWESIFFEKGKKKAICIISPNTNDLIYMQKLLALNFKYVPNNQEVKNYYISLNPLVFEQSDIFDENKNDIVLAKPVDFSGELLKKIIGDLRNRILIKAILTETDNVIDFLTRFVSEKTKNKSNDIREIFERVLDGVTDEEFEDLDWLDDNDASERLIKEKFAGPLSIYYNYKVKHKQGNELFPFTIVWINGPEMSDNIRETQRYLNELLADGTRYNFLPILFVNNDEDLVMQLKMCEYIFLSGTNEKIYNRYGVKYTKKSETPTIDFKIKSLSEERSFKQFSIDIKKLIIPRLDFDNLFGGE